MKFDKGDVIQFNKNHEWCGSLGIIYDIKQISEGIRYTVGVPIPLKGTAYIFVMDHENTIELIGIAKLISERERDYGSER